MAPNQTWKTWEFSRMGGGPVTDTFCLRINQVTVGFYFRFSHPGSTPALFPLMFLNAFTHLLFMLPLEEVESFLSLRAGAGEEAGDRARTGEEAGERAGI